jgi:hypothetical protein
LERLAINPDDRLLIRPRPLAILRVPACLQLPLCLHAPSPSASAGEPTASATPPSISLPLPLPSPAAFHGWRSTFCNERPNPALQLNRLERPHSRHGTGLLPCQTSCLVQHRAPVRGRDPRDGRQSGPPLPRAPTRLLPLCWFWFLPAHSRFELPLRRLGRRLDVVRSSTILRSVGACRLQVPVKTGLQELTRSAYGISTKRKAIGHRYNYPALNLDGLLLPMLVQISTCRRTTPSRGHGCGGTLTSPDWRGSWELLDRPSQPCQLRA